MKGVKCRKISRICDKPIIPTPDDLLEDFSPLKVGKIFPTNSARAPLTLESYRPKRNTCLDYKLSETYLRWQVGDTKIRATQIRGDYVPAPPGYYNPKPKHKSFFFSGRSPVWKFLDEILEEKIEKKQEKNRTAFERYVKNRHKTEGKEARAAHRLITSLAGPVWFQELSPRQMRTIEKLKDCIVRDMNRKTIVNVKANMAELGIYFPPKNKTLKTAMQYCCGNDVEFLLILYQVLNPKRKCYSINDRILLSAVVHLTITETLKECHVRMPSPPLEKTGVCPCTPCRGYPHRPLKVQYESPYLEPYTFKPENRRFSGKYENKHVQYPESPYFCYIDQLREEIKNAGSVLEIQLTEIKSEVEREFVKDMQEAERAYNQLPHKYWRHLVRPTIKIRCTDFSNRPGALKPMDLPPLFPLKDTMPTCTCLKDDSFSDSECCTGCFICDCNKNAKSICICKEYMKTFLKSLCKRCQILHRESTNNIVGGVVEVNGEIVPIVQGIFKEKECNCLDRFQNQLQAVSKGNEMSCKPDKFVIGGLAMTPNGPSYIISTLFTNQQIADQIAAGERKPEEEKCTCNEPKVKKCWMDDFVKKGDEDDEENQEDKEVEDEKVEEKQEESAVMPWEAAHCTCKKELETFLEKQCNCPDCLDSTRPKTAMYVVSGVSSRMDDKGNVENVVNISGVQGRRCCCLPDYMEKIKKLEEYRERIKTRHLLKTQDNQYTIGGVTMSQLGPVYNIQGVQLPITCTCLEDHLNEEEETRRRMPEKPNTGRIKYGISGVTVKEDKNFYNITSALPIQPCSCENIFHTYQDQHVDCLESFQEYIKQTETEVANMEAEMPKEDICQELIHEDNLEDEMEGEQEVYSVEPEVEDISKTMSSEEKTDLGDNVCPCQSLKQTVGGCSCQRSQERSEICYCQASIQKEAEHSLRKRKGISDTYSLLVLQKKEEECSCQKAKERSDTSACQNTDRCVSKQIEEEIADCYYDEEQDGSTNSDSEERLCTDDTDDESDGYYSLGEEEDVEGDGMTDTQTMQDSKIRYDTEGEFVDSDFKRFFIMKKIPCKKRQQEDILKKLLKSLEMDGYPLAKLPECHKLPIFQLWMYLRCGKSWTQQQKRRFNQVTFKYLKHTTYCYNKVKVPKVPITPAAAEKYTWNHFEYLRAMISSLMLNYRREIKQMRVTSAREYFPTLFDYQFPFWTFRDCYFSYLGAKEEDVFLGNSGKAQRNIKRRDMSCFTYNNRK